MATRRDWFALWLGPAQFTITQYKEAEWRWPHWGIRKLGGKRIALDCGRVSFLFEWYPWRFS